MSQWLFVWSAYAVALGGTAGLAALSYAAMRRAEASADALRRE